MQRLQIQLIRTQMATGWASALGVRVVQRQLALWPVKALFAHEAQILGFGHKALGMHLQSQPTREAL